MRNWWIVARDADFTLCDFSRCIARNWWLVTDVSFLCVVKHKDDGQTKFINPNSQRQDRKIKYGVSIGSIHREQG